LAPGVADSDKGFKKIADELAKDAISLDEPDKAAITPASEKPVNKYGHTVPGYGPIDAERWQAAQKAEREQHTLDYMEGLLHYAQSYKHYFAFVGLGNDLGGLNVIEVGPADFPALSQCKGEGILIVIEPMPSEHLERICKEKNIALVTEPLEKLKGLPKPVLQRFGCSMLCNTLLIQTLSSR
jgi:hypothetical protein